MSTKSVLLVGFGAVGAIYSLILKRSEQAAVTVVARSNYEAVADHGIHFQSKKYGDIKGWKPDRLFPSVSAAADQSYSHVVLATKAIPELKRTPELLAPLLSPTYKGLYSQPTYVLMQNGLGVEKDLYNALKQVNPEEEPRIISTAVWIGTRLVNKDVVEHNEFDRVTMGIYRPTTTITTNTPREEAVLSEFAVMLKAGGSEVTIVPEIQRHKYSKNFWNCVLGATAAIARLPLPSIFRPPHLDPGATCQDNGEVAHNNNEAPYGLTADVPYRTPLIRKHTVPFLHDALTEVYNLGVVLFPSQGSVPGLDPNIVQRTLKNTAMLHTRSDNRHRPSMLVDLEMNRPMELDVVIGEVVRLGREKGISMPRIEALYAILLIIQEQLLNPGNGM